MGLSANFVSFSHCCLSPSAISHVMSNDFPHPFQVVGLVSDLVFVFTPDIFHLPEERKVCRELEEMGNKSR